MNKQEIQELTQRLDANIEKGRNLIVEAEGLKVIISKLAEAEKPKRRHGDFGLEEDGETSYPRLITNPASVTGLTVSNKYGEIPPGNKITTIFGNIFDIMKDWGEDLEDGRANIDGFVIEICGDRIVIGGRRFLIDQAEEFWHRLGQIIAMKKRKQS